MILAEAQRPLTLPRPLGRVGTKADEPVPSLIMTWRRAVQDLDPEDGWLLALLSARGVSPHNLDLYQRHWREEVGRGRSLTVSGVLIELGLLTVTELADCLAERIGWKRVERNLLSGTEGERLGRVTIECCRRWDLIPYALNEKIILVASDPRRVSEEGLRDVERLAAAARREPFDVEWQLASRSEFEIALEALGSPAVLATNVHGRKVVEALLQDAAREDASDIHFIPREQSLEVRFRIDGRLWTKRFFAGERREEILANAKIAGGLDIGKKGEPLDGAGKLVLGSRTFKLRYSSMPSQFGQQVVIRLLDQESTALPLSELGFTLALRDQVLAALAEPQGLIYLVGPTGSGKSTTLASMLSHLDGGAFSIRTLENPIEYRLPNAVQSEVSVDMGFGQGLRALLRQDPDYILIGETRDLETAEISIEAGLTGHMCLSTLHANDAIGGFVRLLDLGIETGPLLAACHLFVGQRLVRRLCRRCSRPRENAAEALKQLGLTNCAPSALREPVGCPYCRDGYRGRLAVFEVRSVRDYAEIVQRLGPACANECRAFAHERRQPTMRWDGITKALAGLTTLEEVFANTPA